MKNYPLPTLESLIDQTLFENESDYKMKLQQMNDSETSDYYEKMIEEKDNFIKTVILSLFHKIQKYSTVQIEEKAQFILKEYSNQ